MAGSKWFRGFACSLAFAMTLAGASRAAAACNLASQNWADRDDDGDGICNGVDSCPFVSNPNQTGPTDFRACSMRAITVPWVPNNPNAPHVVVSGQATTLKGIARDGGDQFAWDAGDGTGMSAWQSMNGNPWNLGLQHTYNGQPGQLFIAKLYVRSSSNPGLVASANYQVLIQNAADSTDPSQMDVRIAAAIDEMLWWMHVNASRSTYTDGTPGYRQPYENLDTRPATCAALDAFDLHGSQPLLSQETDPYVEDSRRLLNYVTANMYAVGIPTSMGYADGRTVNTAGTGIYFTHALGYEGAAADDFTYVDGICGAALGSIKAPVMAAMTGNNGIYNQPYSTLAQQAVDWFTYSQNKTGGPDGLRGGWWYFENESGADGSTNQWPILAMSSLSENLNATVPQVVKDEQANYLAYTHNLNTADANYGGWGYNSSTYIPNVAKTAAGMVSSYWLGKPASDPSVQAGLGFIFRHWADNDNSWMVNVGNSYAMYGVAKAMRKVTPNILRVVNYGPGGVGDNASSFDWYYQPAGQTQPGIAVNIVNRVQSDGSIPDSVPGSHNLTRSLTTAWDSIILNKAVTAIPPSAVICECTATYANNQSITFDGSCSTDNDIKQHIAKYEWDFAYDGANFVTSQDANNNPYVSLAPTTSVTKADGFPNFTQNADGSPTGTTYLVALRVSDDTPATMGGPLTSIGTCKVNIKPPPHCPRVVNNGPYLVSVNKPVTFTAAGSSDPDNDPITYSWNINYTAADEATGPTYTKTFTAPGRYTVRLTGTDHPESNATPYNPCNTAAGPNDCKAPFTNPNGDCPVQTFTYVDVGNHPPVAVPGGPYTMVKNSSITLDGTGSYSPDGNSFTYAWDFAGGANHYMDSTSAKPTFTIGEVAAGTQLHVCLQVTDQFDYVSQPVCTNVNVAATQEPPLCKIIPQAPAACTGGPQSFVLDGSGSLDLNGEALSYQWTTDCPGSFNYPGESQSKLTIDSTHLGCQKKCTASLTVSNGTLSSSCTTPIEIDDRNGPAFVSSPQPLKLECGPGTGAAVNTWLGNVSAVDACAPTGSPITFGNDFRAASGGCGGVAIGSSVPVTWTASNSCGNSSQVSASVTVVDTTAPALSVPANITTTATGVGTIVTFAVTATDFVSGATPVTCTPASGSSFPIGTTTVNCTSKDGAGNVGNGSFQVTVNPGAPNLTAPGNGLVTTLDKPVTFTGTALPGATIAVVENGKTVGSGTAGAGGGFSFGVSFLPGPHTVTVTQTLNGATSPATPAIAFAVKPPIPTLGTTPRAFDNRASFTGLVPSVPSSIKVYDAGVLIATVQADQTGAWSFNGLSPRVLADGPHALSFTMLNNGIEGDKAAFAFTLWTPAPALVLTPADGSTQTGVAQPLGFANASGYAPPPGIFIATVAYTFDGKAFYSGNAFGAPASIDLGAVMPGIHTVTLFATDNVGNAMTATLVSRFTYAPSIDADIALAQRFLGPLAVTCPGDDGGSGNNDDGVSTGRHFRSSRPVVPARSRSMSDPRCRGPHLSTSEYNQMTMLLQDGKFALSSSCGKHNGGRDDDNAQQCIRRAEQDLYSYEKELTLLMKSSSIPQTTGALLVADADSLLKALIRQYGGSVGGDD